jgi:hypothetical protein
LDSAFEQVRLERWQKGLTEIIDMAEQFGSSLNYVQRV